MNLKRIWLQSRYLCLCLWGLFLCTGCEHRQLEEASVGRDIFVRVYYNENIRNVSFGFYDESKKKPEYSSPRMMRVMFFDNLSDKLVSERYLYDCGRDEKGYYIQGNMNVPDGKYNMLAYNFDTREIETRNNDSYYAMTAYTEPLSESEANRFFSSRGDDATNISRQPDHLFVGKIEGLNIGNPESVEVPDTIKNNQGVFPIAETIVKTYYLQFNIKGVEHVRSAVALISGMAGSKNMHSNEMVKDDVASIYFNLNNGKDKARANDDVAVAYASFNTFGKLPHTEGYLDVTFEFKTIYNTIQTEKFRITDIFETEMAKENQWIIIDKVVEIIPPEGDDTGGGMAPGVSEWEEIEGSITI